MWYYAIVNQSVKYCMAVFIYMCKHIYLYIHIHVYVCVTIKETFFHICTCENIHKFKQDKKIWKFTMYSFFCLYALRLNYYKNYSINAEEG